MDARRVDWHSGWWRVASAAICAFAAAFAWIAYLSNGIVVGALIGLPGREADIAEAHHRAIFSMALALLAQLGTVLSLSILLTIGAEFPRFPRILARGCIASLLSIPVTVAAGLVLILIARFLR